MVVRYRLGVGAPADWRQGPNPAMVAGPSQSDITGLLRERTDELLTVEREGELHQLPVAAIVSVRLLSRRVVRNSEIREVERTLMAAAADHCDEIAGWLVNAHPDHPVTDRRAAGHLRSAAGAPIEFGSTAAGLPEVVAWFAVRGLPPRLMVADRLLRTSSLSTVPSTVEAYEVLVGPAPDGETPPGDWSLLADGVAAATVSAVDDSSRAAWRRLGFELHHTCRLLTL